MKKNKLKMFIVRTYVMANDVKHAMRIASKQQPDEVFVDNDWKEGRAIGFINNQDK